MTRYIDVNRCLLSPIGVFIIVIIHWLLVVRPLDGFVVPYGSTFVKRGIPLIDHDIRTQSTQYNKHRTTYGIPHVLSTTKEEGDDDAMVEMEGNQYVTSESETEQLQAKLNEMASADDLPMFSFDFDPSSFDDGNVPLPAFTASVLFVLSTSFTIYMYYIGIHGFD